jgi:16S rRNA (guanine527-N7)-methyltransferase
MNFHSHFENLSSTQEEQLHQLLPLYTFWNAQINVVSRKDIDLLMERHVLHSLAIAKIVDFQKGTKIMDVGTGGGFPGIPLAILYPDVDFLLIDSIAKKIKVVKEVVQSLGLKNVKAVHGRAENVTQKFDFIVSRAVTKMPAFIDWVKDKIDPICVNEFPNGILYLKGGDLSEEFSTVKQHYKEFDISDFYSDEFYETKKVVYVQLV